MKNTQTPDQLKIHAGHIRSNTLKAIHQAQSGHPGGSLSAAEIITVLYFDEMRINPDHPEDDLRDRFVLSKGHCAPVYYAALAERGYFSEEEVLHLRQYGHFLQGHPDMKHTPGVDMSSGSLGQGISAAAGMALGARLRNKNSRIYTLLGDGELEEGQVWEAAMFAGAKKLDNLCVIIDNNDLQIDGHLRDVNSPYPIDRKFEAFNFYTQVVEDGNDIEQLQAAFKRARQMKGRPSAIICQTVKGKGVSFMENQAGWHGKAPNDEQLNLALKEIGSRA